VLGHLHKDQARDLLKEARFDWDRRVVQEVKIYWDNLEKKEPLINK